MPVSPTSPTRTVTPGLCKNAVTALHHPFHQNEQQLELGQLTETAYGCRHSAAAGDCGVGFGRPWKSEGVRVVWRLRAGRHGPVYGVAGLPSRSSARADGGFCRARRGPSTRSRVPDAARGGAHRVSYAGSGGDRPLEERLLHLQRRLRIEPAVRSRCAKRRLHRPRRALGRWRRRLRAWRHLMGRQCRHCRGCRSDWAARTAARASRSPRSGSRRDRGTIHDAMNVPNWPECSRWFWWSSAAPRWSAVATANWFFESLALRRQLIAVKRLQRTTANRGGTRPFRIASASTSRLWLFLARLAVCPE